MAKKPCKPAQHNGIPCCAQGCCANETGDHPDPIDDHAVSRQHPELPKEHASARHLRQLIIVLSLTFTVFIAELVGSYVSSSLALLADAGHMAVDSAGLLIATITVVISRRPRSDKYTWGWVRVEAISAAFQSGMLLIVAIFIVVQACLRLFTPVEVLPFEMAIFGAIGLAANLIGMVMLFKMQDESLNMKAAFLEVLNDTLGSIMVLVASGLYAGFAWTWADSIASLLVAMLMGPRALRLLRTSLAVLLESTPPEVDLDTIRTLVLDQPHVVDIHDLHVSTISTGLVSLTAHVVLEEKCFQTGHSLQILHSIQHELETAFHIPLTHSTIQLESEHHREHELLAHDQAIQPGHGHAH